MSSPKKYRVSTSSDYTSYEYYKSIVLDNTVECVWVYSLSDKCFRYISPSIYNLRGLTVEEAMKESLEDACTPESLQKIKNAEFKRISRFMAGDRSEEIVSDISEYEQYCKDGSTKIIESSTRLVINEKNNSLDVIGVSRDMTKRKEYEKGLIKQIKAKTELLEKTNPILKNNVSNIRIYFFNKFSVYGKGQVCPVRWRTSKTEELFAFLLINGNNTINKDVIIENLWPDIELEKATAYLHNTLYYMKKDLLNLGIEIQLKCKNNYYTYNLPEFYSDTKEFEYILSNTILPFESVDDKSAACFEKILSIYEGDLLDQNGYLWAIPHSKKIYENFRSVALLLAKYYFFKRNYIVTKQVLQRLLELDNWDETVHELLLKVYLQNQEYSSFLFHYSELEKFLLCECNARPKTSLQNLYNQFYNEAKQMGSEKTAHF